jgi:hypothetical protein
MLVAIGVLVAIQLLHLAISVPPDVADTNDVVTGKDNIEGR